MLTINATKRDETVDNAEIRAEGKVPAVFYGPKEANTSIIINEGDLLKVYNEAGESTVITLKDGDAEHEVLIHDIQWDAVSQRPLHVDFYVIEKGKKISVDIPLEFIGESPAVKTMAGVLVKVMHEVEVEAMPKDLPQHLEVDISALVDFESHVKASDIVLPAGVELLTEAEETVALVQAPKEEEEAPAAPADLDSIEVEKKGKEEEAPAEGEDK